MRETYYKMLKHILFNPVGYTIKLWVKNNKKYAKTIYRENVGSGNFIIVEAEANNAYGDYTVKHITRKQAIRFLKQYYRHGTIIKV